MYFCASHVNMRIVILATQQQKDELLQKGFPASANIEWIDNKADFANARADAFFYLNYDDNDLNDEGDFNDNKNEFDTIVFIHAVNITCKELKRKNYIRLNAWQGFLNRSIIELAACNENYKQKAVKIFNALNWKFVWVADDYGLISARIIAMIINEAYYALQENVSSKEQIDIAMKLGTNYPYGPFEWSERIGLKNIYTLLKKLSAQNERYTIADALQKAATNK